MTDVNDAPQLAALVAEFHELADEAAGRYRALATVVQQARDTGRWRAMGDDRFEDWCRRVFRLDVAWMYRVLWVADHPTFVPDPSEVFDFELAQCLAGEALDEAFPNEDAR